MEWFQHNVGDKTFNCGFKSDNMTFELNNLTGVFTIMGKQLTLKFNKYKLTGRPINKFIYNINGHSDLILNGNSSDNFVKTWTQETDDYNLKYFSKFIIDDKQFAIKAHMKIFKGKGHIKYDIHCEQRLSGYITIGGSRYPLTIDKVGKVKYNF